jgi:hypothetical protein
MADTPSLGFYFDALDNKSDPNRLFFKAVCLAMDIERARLKPNHFIGLVGRMIPFINDNQLPVTISGAASNTGSADFNQRLSEQRARNMAQALEDFGVDPALIVSVQGLGIVTRTNTLLPAGTTDDNPTGEDRLHRGVIISVELTQTGAASIPSPALVAALDDGQG